MNQKQIVMHQDFESSVKKYKDAMKHSRETRSAILRAVYGVRTFGFSYIFHTLRRFRIPIPVKDTEIRLFWGDILTLPASDIGTHSLSMYGLIPHRSERKLTEYLIWTLKSDDVFYDVGAHLGFYTALARALLAKGNIYAFEANTNLYKYLKKNFTGCSGVTAEYGVVASTPGETDFYDATNISDSSASSRFNIVDSKKKPQKVQTIVLDEYVRVGNKAPTIIKFDIEGGEYDAIVGSREIIAKYRPIIILEVWGGELGKTYSARAVKEIFSHGYAAYVLERGGELSRISVVDPVEFATQQTSEARENFVLIPCN